MQFATCYSAYQPKVIISIVIWWAPPILRIYEDWHGNAIMPTGARRQIIIVVIWSRIENCHTTSCRCRGCWKPALCVGRSVQETHGFRLFTFIRSDNPCHRRPRDHLFRWRRGVASSRSHCLGFRINMVPPIRQLHAVPSDEHKLKDVYRVFYAE